VWREWGLQPWRAESFKFSTDPRLDARVRDVIGLYLNPPDKAVVLYVDEKPQAQALERAAPVLPLRPGIPEKRSHDYIRHGTTTLFAALEAATGKVIGASYPRHRHAEFLQFLQFLRQVAKAYPRRKLHLVVDNYGTHTHPDVRAWLDKHPRITLHFTPPQGRGGTWSRSSSRSSPGRPSAAAASPRSPTSSPRSRPSSTAEMTAAARSPGPRPPTRSSRNAARVKEPRSRH
jgi:hypothetical protein